MSVSKKRNSKRRIVDAAMTVVLLFLMAYQVTGEAAHEWIGVSMTILVIVHQILNRKWYGALFKGKYNPYRILTTVLSILLVLCFAMTAFCGMSMSGYAVPFMYGLAPVSFVRRMHLSMSHWAFVLMGLHLGMHIPAMAAVLKWSDRTRNMFTGLSTLAAGLGLYLFIRNGMPDYLFFRVPFAFLDYDKAAVLVIVENLLMLSTWVLIGTRAAQLCRTLGRLGVSKENRLVPVVCIMAAVIIGMLFVLAGLSAGKSTSFGNADWSAPQEESGKNSEPESAQEALPGSEAQEQPADKSVDDGYALIEGGTFLMGSPDTENWRIDDETQHEVTVAAFYIDPHETTQAEYVRLMGDNPFAFSGEDLPVESISWLDAIRYANAKSEDAGLTPVYTITENSVTWDRSADGYRLPTEAEWEQRAQTEKGGKILIAYFSWSGNTRGIAQEIQSQTGADLFEITPVNPYSTDYNTVLMEAQEDQHKQARPELSAHVQNMDDYDIILLGYPNWWASIPMPIASFLEEYDFSGKTIVPFCSHGGGLFGQSLTAIAKLAPNSVIGEGLSVHYSGGTSLSSDVTEWLKTNGISK